MTRNISNGLPDIYRMGQLLGRDDLKKLAILMYRSCGQLIDPYGSQGEQIQQTNYGQHGRYTSIDGMRGDYVETWTVFWITAHFLNAGAQFLEMGYRCLRKAIETIQKMG